MHAGVLGHPVQNASHRINQQSLRQFALHRELGHDSDVARRRGVKRHGLSKEEGGVAVAQVRWRLQHAVGDVDGSELSVSADAKRIAAHSVGTESGGNLSLSHPRESVDTGTGRSDVVGVNREDLGESGGGGGGRRGVEGGLASRMAREEDETVSFFPAVRVV